MRDETPWELIILATAILMLMLGFSLGTGANRVDPDLRIIQKQRDALRMYEEAGKIQP